jgi:hypothetical protein
MATAIAHQILIISRYPIPLKETVKKCCLKSSAVRQTLAIMGGVTIVPRSLKTKGNKHYFQAS